MVSSNQQLCKVAFHDSPRQETMDKEYESLKNNEKLDHFSLPPKQRDKTTFIHGKLEEEIYMEKPKGYTDDSLLTCKLRNPLYGIKKSPRAWNPNSNSSILSQSFEILKESGEVHMHCTMGPVHIRTITLR